MRRLILVLTLPLMMFIFSLPPNAGAQIVDPCVITPEGVIRVYKCVLECHSCILPPDEPQDVPQCDLACTSLEDTFSGIENCNIPCVLERP